MFTILGPDIPAGTHVVVFHIAAVCATGGPPARPSQQLQYTSVHVISMECATSAGG